MEENKEYREYTEFKAPVTGWEFLVRSWWLWILVGYLRDKYPTQHAEAFLHACTVNEDKITELKTLLEKL